LAAGNEVKVVPPFLESLFKKTMQPYLISWFKFDPAIELAKLKIPTLIIQGDNDVQVDVDDAKRLAELSPKSKILIIEKMNHLFKIITGDKNENLKSYSNPALPNSEKMTEEIVRFINKN
jgi:uncharacterized protein